jgi:hypothetical protein
MTLVGAYRQRGRKRRVLVKNVRFLAGNRRPGLVDEARPEHAFADGRRGTSRCRGAAPDRDPKFMTSVAQAL